MISRPESVSFWRSFGPGLLWAAAAIGVSHLVQTTRAGSSYGFGLLLVIVVTLVLKYPFFEFGPRYAAATGTSLVEGYRHIGRWALWLYLGLTVMTSVIVHAAITLFTAFLLKQTFQLDWSLPVTGALLVLLAAALLRLGRFRALDLSIKVIMVLLAVSTLAAVAASFGQADFSTVALYPRDFEWSVSSFGFLLALVGWMPSAVDISVWSSLWTLAKNESCNHKVSVRGATLDFAVGYVGSALLALAFLFLGATVMYPSGVVFSPQGTVFATQLIELYVQALGGWAQPIVSVAVLTTMISTLLTVVDGFPRSIERSLLNLRERDGTRMVQGGRIYWLCYILLGVSTTIILAYFVTSFTSMIDFATILSFLTGPVLGYLNLRAVTSSEVDPIHRPGPLLRVLSWLGLVILGVTGIAWVAVRWL